MHSLPDPSTPDHSKLSAVDTFPNTTSLTLEMKATTLLLALYATTALAHPTLRKADEAIETHQGDFYIMLEDIAAHSDAASTQHYFDHDISQPQISFSTHLVTISNAIARFHSYHSMLPLLAILTESEQELIETMDRAWAPDDSSEVDDTMQLLGMLDLMQMKMQTDIVEQSQMRGGDGDEDVVLTDLFYKPPASTSASREKEKEDGSGGELKCRTEAERDDGEWDKVSSLLTYTVPN